MRRVWLFFALLIIAYAVLILVGRELMPVIGRYQPEINSYLSDRLGLHFQTDRFNGAWRGLSPSIGVSGLGIAANESAEEAVSVDRIEAEFNLLKSAFGWSPVWESLTVGNARIRAQEDENGRWSVAGHTLGQKQGDPGILLNMLFSSRFIGVENVTLELGFFSGTRALIHATGIQVENAGDFHRLKARLSLDDAGDTSAQLVVEGVGDPLDPESFKGKGYLALSRINFDASLFSIVKRWLPEQAEKVGEIDTELDLAFWFDIRDNSIVNGRGHISAEEIPLNWVADVPSLTGLNATVTGWYEQGRDWGFRLQELEANWGDEAIEPLTLQFRQRVGKYWGDLQVAADHLDLDIFNRLLHRTGLLPARADEILGALAPTGSLRQLWVDMHLDKEKSDFRLRANLDDVGQQSWKGSPASRGINGYVEARLDRGFVELDTPEGFAMLYPQAYDDYMPYGGARGRVDWQWLRDESRVLVTSGPIAIDGEEGHGQVHLALDLPTRQDVGEPEMTLMVSLRDSHSRYLTRYLPNKLPEQLHSWLLSAVGEAEVPEVGFIWRGSLRKDNHEGRTIQLYTRVRNGALDYQPGWPGLTGLNAQLVVSDGQLDAWASATEPAGQLGEADIRTLNVQLRPQTPATGESGGQLLRVQSEVSARSGYALRVLADSPLQDRLGDFRRWQLSGESDIRLDLAIPLGGAKSGEQYDVKTTVNDGTLALPDTDLRFTGLKGEVDFSLAKGLYSKAIDGQFLGNALQAAIATRNGQTRVAIKGAVSMPTLSPYLSLFAPYLSGRTDIAGTLVIPSAGSEAVPTLSLESSTRGVVSTLPAPLAKASDEAHPLKATVTFDGGSIRTEGVIQDLLAAQWLMHGSEFQRGEVQLLGDSAALPEQAGLRIAGDLPALDWADWQPILAPDDKPSPAAPEAQQNPPHALATLRPVLALNFDNLTVSGVGLGKTALGGAFQQSRSGQGAWHLAVDSDRLKGNIRVPGDEGRIALDLDYLHLPALTTKDDTDLQTADPQSADPQPEGASTSQQWNHLDTLDPQTLPTLDFAVQNLWLGESNVGSLAFRALRRPNGMTFDQIRGSLKGLQLGGEQSAESDSDTAAGLTLVWTKDNLGHHSYVSGTVTAEKLGNLLEDWGHPRALNAKRGAFFLDLAWDAQPWAYDVLLFSGYFGIDLSDGQFYEVTGVATNTFFKLVSLFNFDTWLRRLRFDFSDLFNEGVSFDTVNGGLVFNRGSVTFDAPISVTMPSGKIRLLGTTDVEQELLNARLVATMPVGTNLPWVVGLLGGLPAAAGVYVTGKLFEKQVNKLSSISYTVTGPWDDPEVKVDKIFSDKIEQ